MSEHTPESWTFEWLEADYPEGTWDLKITEFTISEIGGDRNDIAAIFFNEGATVTTTREQAAEIARLFAAAPETKDQLAELVAAAEPFAALAQFLPEDMPDDSYVMFDGPSGKVWKAGQIRALAAAVAAAKGE